jgi:tRNA(Ile)-lysidine synthase TilS/MesJ
MIKQGEVVGFRSRGDFRGVVLDEMLKMFAERAHIKLVKNGKSHRSVYPKLRSKGAIKVAVDFTLDIEADEIVHAMIKKDAKKLKVLPVDGKIIRPLYLFLDKEVLLYAKIRKLRFKEKKVVKDKISKFVDLMEEKHPEVKRAIVNSYLKLYS